MQRKIWKKLLIVTVMAVLCVAVGVTANAQDRFVIDSGDCGVDGDTVAWILYDDGELVISGNGKMNGWFVGRDDIKSVVVEEGITDFGGEFAGCENLSDIHFAESLETICGSFGATALKEVVIPDNVKSLDVELFYGCYTLEKVYFGKSVQIPYDGENNAEGLCFLYCSNIKAFEVSDENEYYSTDENGILYNKDKTVLCAYPASNGMESFVIPDSVKRIAAVAFGFAGLKEVIIPESVESVDSMAFGCCGNLETVKIYGNLISETAFYMCYNLKDVYVYSDTTDFGEMVFGTDVIATCDFADFARKFYNDEDDGSIIYLDDILQTATIYCHDDDKTYTAEAYAQEYGIPFERCHFYAEEWIYDYDKMIRYRECTFKNCNARIEEALETTNSGDVEIIEPVDPDTDFVVDVVTDYVIIEEALSNGIAGDFEIIKAFDITMTGKDGVHVQPNGTVKVKLPNDWSKNGVYKVYRVNDDGTLTDMNAYRQGSHMVFETDHFSIYVIVDESEKTGTPVTPDEPQEETKDGFFAKIIDLIKAFFELIASIFKK